MLLRPHTAMRLRTVSEEASLPENKVVLVVDDEPDIIDTICEILEQCRIETAGSYAVAREMLRDRTYDLVILDIMGVKGLELLDIAVERQFPSVMLTAPAMTPEYLLKSVERGAVSYIPKQDLAHLDTLLDDIFRLLEEGRSVWDHTMSRLEPLFDETFPPDWKREFRRLEVRRTGDESG